MSDISIKVGSTTVQRVPGRSEDIKQISAKLHPAYDQDLKNMLSKIPKRERSKFYRDAVRYCLSHGMR